MAGKEHPLASAGPAAVNAKEVPPLLPGALVSPVALAGCAGGISVVPAHSTACTLHCLHSDTAAVMGHWKIDSLPTLSNYKSTTVSSVS